jgi:hypothetical protein
VVAVLVNVPVPSAVLSVSVPVPTVPVVMIPELLLVMLAVVEQSSWVA